jgi:2-methylisocitrate lyase-like PEP mutase family enzyme
MSDRSGLPALAERLAALHVPGTPLVIPNAWDAASARVFEKVGFPAVATSSSAVAKSLGYEDGEQTPVDEVFAAVRRVARAVDVPVTADLERGYGLDPEELVERILDSGAVGCNLEDSDPRSSELIDVAEQAGWLGRVRAAADDAGVPIALNARIDVHLREWGAPDGRASEAIERGRAYRAAGATCVYPIGMAARAEIEEVVRGVDGPVNIVFLPGGLSIEELAGAGVARVSFGGGLHIAMRAHLKIAASRIREGLDPYEGL